jgi:hypothetical protein
MKIEMALCPECWSGMHSQCQGCDCECNLEEFMFNDSSEDFDDYDREEYDEEEDFDCGAMRDLSGRMVGCSMAGSEDCDFDCPYRESVERSLRAQAGWAKRKKKA